MIRMICLDYDNTIYDHKQGKIPDSARAAIEAIRGKCRIVLASGRFFKDVWNAPMLEEIRPDGVIHANGALIEADARELIGVPMHGLFLDDSVEAAKLIAERFPQLRTPIMSEERGGADVLPVFLSKAYGLQKLAEHWGISLEETAAVGDSMNDYEMVREAGVGIAMGNAVSKLKEAADYVTADIGEDGLEKAFEYLGLL